MTDLEPVKTDQKFLLVRLEAGLPQHRTTGLFCAIKLYPGVEMVCDLSAISQATLDVVLRKPEPDQPKKRRKSKSAAA